MVCSAFGIEKAEDTLVFLNWQIWQVELLPIANVLANSNSYVNHRVIRRLAILLAEICQALMVHRSIGIKPEE
jgi:hypothetical protein